jgi:hypothetical protein
MMKNSLSHKAWGSGLVLHLRTLSLKSTRYSARQFLSTLSPPDGPLRSSEELVPHGGEHAPFIAHGSGDLTISSPWWPPLGWARYGLWRLGPSRSRVPLFDPRPLPFKVTVSIS